MPCVCTYCLSISLMRLRSSCAILVIFGSSGGGGGARGGGARGGGAREETYRDGAYEESDGYEDKDSTADEADGEDADGDADGEDAEQQGDATAMRDRTGDQVEVQECDPDQCEMFCGICDWEAGVVIKDHRHGCDVQFQNGDICYKIANRFLRAPTVTDAMGRKKRARR